MGQKRRIAIFTHGDYAWSFPTWANTLPILKERHDIIGIYLFSRKMGHLKGLQIPQWFLRVFGPVNCLLLSAYSMKTRLMQVSGPVRGWDQLASRYDVPLHYADTPHSQHVCEWVKENRVDIILIMVWHILKKEIIESPRIGIINKHTALLPSYRGVFPFFCARLKGDPIGITFHEVDVGIDTGAILLQERCPEREDAHSGPSLLRFYIETFSRYPSMVLHAIERLGEGHHIPLAAGVTPSYYGFPTRNDYRQFKKAGHKIARMSDLFYAPDGWTSRKTGGES